MFAIFKICPSTSFLLGGLNRFVGMLFDFRTFLVWSEPNCQMVKVQQTVLQTKHLVFGAIKRHNLGLDQTEPMSGLSAVFVWQLQFGPNADSGRRNKRGEIIFCGFKTQLRYRHYTC